MKEKVARLKDDIKNEKDRLSPKDLGDLKKLKSKEGKLEKKQQEYDDFLETNKRLMAKEKELAQEIEQIKADIEKVEANIEKNDREWEKIRDDKKAEGKDITRVTEKGYDLIVEKEALTEKMKKVNGLLDEHRKNNLATYDERDRLKKETENAREEIDKITTRRTEEWHRKEPGKSASIDKKRKQLSQVNTFLDDVKASRIGE